MSHGSKSHKRKKGKGKGKGPKGRSSNHKGKASSASGSGPSKHAKTPAPAPAGAGNIAVAEKTEESEPQGQSWGAWLGSWFSSSGEVDATHEIEGDDQQIFDGLGTSETAIFGEGVKEDEFELPTPDVITVNLVKKDFERQFGSVSSKGSVSIDRVLSGYKGKAEFEVSNAYEQTTELGKVSFLGGLLTGQFTQETSFGDKYSAKGEGAWTAEEVAAKAELNAFSGYSDATKAEFKITVGGRTIATFTGTAGTTLGTGGKLKGEMKFAGGKVTWGGQATVSSGYGAVLDYKVAVDGGAIAGGLWSWASTWASWLWDAAGSLGEALLDEDGDPIIL